MKRCDWKKNQRWPTVAMFFDRSFFFFFFFFFFFCTCTTRHRVENSDQDLKENPTSGLGGDAITSLSMGNFTKSEPGTKRPNLSTDRNFFCSCTFRH